MTDRPTDFELDEATRHANAVAAHVGKEGVLGPRELVVADLLLLAERVVTYADEIREHRAARTLTHDELSFVESARWLLSHHGMAVLSAPKLLAIIDRMTEEADRD